MSQGVEYRGSPISVALCLWSSGKQPPSSTSTALARDRSLGLLSHRLPIKDPREQTAAWTGASILHKKSSQDQTLAVWKFAAKLPNSDLNFAMDFGVDFFVLFFPRKKAPKNPPKNPPQNSPRNELGKIPLGFLQKPSLEKLKISKSVPYLKGSNYLRASRKISSPLCPSCGIPTTWSNACQETCPNRSLRPKVDARP